MTAETDGVRAETLLADVARLGGRPCPSCGRPLDGRAVLAAVWLGFRDAPRCPGCIAIGLGREPAEFLAQVRAVLQRRDCYREAWETVVDREGGDDVDAQALAAAPAASTSRTPPIESGASPASPASPGERFVWDAGDLGCGDLVLELRTRLRAMPPLSLLSLTAHDPGAPEDIPAWCGLVGHRLVSAAHPHYLICRKAD